MARTGSLGPLPQHHARSRSRSRPRSNERDQSLKVELRMPHAPCPLEFSVRPVRLVVSVRGTCNERRVGSLAIPLGQLRACSHTTLEVLFDGDNGSTFVEAAEIKLLDDAGCVGSEPDENGRLSGREAIEVRPHEHWPGQQGIFARRGFETAQAVFDEAPIIFVAGGPSTVPDAIHMFLNLPQQAQRAVLDLRAKTGANVMDKKQFAYGLSLQGAAVPANRVEDAWKLALILSENWFQTSAGNALFLLLSRMNHSCDPNSFRADGIGGHFTQFALKPIAAGEEITHSYCSDADLVLPVSERQQILLVSRGYACTCTRCTNAADDMRVFKCTETGCSGLQYVARASVHESESDGEETHSDDESESKSSISDHCDELSKCRACGASGWLTEAKRLLEAKLAARYFKLEAGIGADESAEPLLELLGDLVREFGTDEHWLCARLHNLLVECFSAARSMDLDAAVAYRRKNLTFWDAHIQRPSLKRAWLREQLGDLLLRKNSPGEAAVAYGHSLFEMRLVQLPGSEHCTCVHDKLLQSIQTFNLLFTASVLPVQ